jgi:hypothetical protein
MTGVVLMSASQLQVMAPTAHPKQKKEEGEEFVIEGALEFVRI